MKPTTKSGYALTICAYRKPDMTQEAYHDYISQNHAPLLKDLLLKNKITSYTMQHNTSETKELMPRIFGGMPESHYADYDCFVQIVFRDVDDYLNVLKDEHFQQVVAPDHHNFADPEKTKFITGWFEEHITNSKIA